MDEDQIVLNRMLIFTSKFYLQMIVCSIRVFSLKCNYFYVKCAMLMKILYFLTQQ